ncbi:hypothetical protein HMI56_004359, partial [Coelomomyces lativittatus]
MFDMTEVIRSSLHQRGMVIGEVAKGGDGDPEGIKGSDTSPKRLNFPLNVVRLDEYATFEDKDEIIILAKTVCFLNWKLLLIL